jgi:hypothetical protein
VICTVEVMIRKGLLNWFQAKQEGPLVSSLNHVRHRWVTCPWKWSHDRCLLDLIWLILPRRPPQRPVDFKLIQETEDNRNLCFLR